MTSYFVRAKILRAPSSQGLSRAGLTSPPRRCHLIIMRAINLIVIHCSDSDIPEHDSVDIVRSWHIERGWSDIGYSYYISQSGNLAIGRPIGKPGAHAKGKNTHSIGICLGGRNSFSKEQFKTLRQLIKNLLDIFGKDLLIKGHYELDGKKSCPNIDMQEFRGSLDVKNN